MPKKSTVDKNYMKNYVASRQAEAEKRVRDNWEQLKKPSTADKYYTRWQQRLEQLCPFVAPPNPIPQPQIPAPEAVETAIDAVNPFKAPVSAPEAVDDSLDLIPLVADLDSVDDPLGELDEVDFLNGVDFDSDGVDFDSSDSDDNRPVIGLVTGTMCPVAKKTFPTAKPKAVKKKWVRAKTGRSVGRPRTRPPRQNQVHGVLPKNYLCDFPVGLLRPGENYTQLAMDAYHAYVASNQTLPRDRVDEFIQPKNISLGFCLKGDIFYDEAYPGGRIWAPAVNIANKRYVKQSAKGEIMLYISVGGSVATWENGRLFTRQMTMDMNTYLTRFMWADKKPFFPVMLLIHAERFDIFNRENREVEFTC